jgi:SDR family mycofactocin-dependent oxidoreductase
MGRFDGKVALITGGARGQGRSHALALAREGADIAVCDVCDDEPTMAYPMGTEADLKETSRLVEDLGRRCLTIKADVTRSADVAGVVEQTVGDLGRIDILCANAGIMPIGVPTWEVSEERWDRTVDVLLKGVWLSCKHVVPQMLAQGSGAIILTASVAGLQGFMGLCDYTAAKHGVVGLTKTLSQELGPLGIRVNAVCPTSVNTPMIQNQPTYDMFTGGAGGTEEAAAEVLRGLQLLDIPWIEAEDVSNAVVWLASDEARYVTGLALPIDAGATAKFQP